MLAHEEVHCARFEFLIQHERIRPSFFMLIWEKAAYGLGRVSAWLGEPYAMALTEGIETVIEQHYESQLRYLLPENESLRPLLEKCLEEEKEHKHLGGAYHRGGLVIRLFRSFSERVTRAAVFVAERL
jgi:ubiquinone biosynthesis monooxygenase Coq7